MQRITLGSDGLEVSVLGYGLMSLSGAYGESDDARGLATIGRALDLGIRFLDTAEAYGDGHNERLAGRALARRRDEVVLATKWGVSVEGGRMEAGGRPEQARRAIEGSLTRLDTDRVDLYYLHRPDPDVPIEESVGGMARLVEEGKVLQLGLSGVASTTLRRAWSEHPIAALQSEFSIASREAEGTLLETCAELGTRFVAYSPLGRGLLSGELRSPEAFEGPDLRRVCPRLQGEAFASNLERVDALAALAEELEITPAQLALAWVRAQGAIPLFGTRSIARLEANLRAADIELDAATLQRIDEIAPPGAFEGASLPESLDHLTEHEPTQAMTDAIPS